MPFRNSKEKRMIAWGASKLLKMYLDRTNFSVFEYCVDNFCMDSKIGNLPVKRPDTLKGERSGSFQIVIFAASNKSLQEISHYLYGQGLFYGKDFIYYSDFFYKNFLLRAESQLGFKFNQNLYQFALSFTINSQIPIHSTILGSWMFLEILGALNNLDGSVAEVGAFQGGNALCALQFMTKLKTKNFYIFDSFSGFPELGDHDPKKFKKGDYNINSTFQEVSGTFSLFPNVRLIKGFVPASFSEVPPKEKFSVVFFDCDLYQPALDTFDFFWDRIIPGGYLLVHDYLAEQGGFEGVKRATDEFFGPKKIQPHSFFENTMAVIRKPVYL